MSDPRRSPAERFLRFLTGLDPGTQEAGRIIRGTPEQNTEQWKTLGNTGLDVLKFFAGVDPGTMQASQTIRGTPESRTEDWRQVARPFEWLLTAPDEPDQSTKTAAKKPKTARQEKRAERHAKTRRDLYVEQLGVDPGVAQVMADADVARMRTQSRYNQAEEEGTLPGSPPPGVDSPVDWDAPTEGELDSMSIIDLQALVQSVGGSGSAGTDGYGVISPEDVYRFAVAGVPERGPAGTEYPDDLEEQIRDSLKGELERNIYKAINPPFDYSSRPSSPDYPGDPGTEPDFRQSAEGAESEDGVLSNAWESTLPGQIQQGIQEFYGAPESTEEPSSLRQAADALGQFNPFYEPAQTQEQAQPVEQSQVEVPTDISAMSEEEKDFWYTIVVPMWTTKTKEPLPDRDTLIQLFLDRWHSSETGR